MKTRHIYSVGSALAVFTYSYVYGNHNEFVRIILAVSIIWIIYNIIIYAENIEKDARKRVDIVSDFEDIKKALLIEDNIQWLEHNEYLVNIIQNLHSIVKHDKEIFRDLILDLNLFLKLYYTAIVDDHPLMYSNLKDHQEILQSLEALHKQIVQNMKNLVFVLKTDAYHHIMNIPKKIDEIELILNRKIKLLYHKFKLRPSKQKSL